MPRPSTELKPSLVQLTELEQLIAEGRLAEAEMLLPAFLPANALEEAWINYFLGILAFEQQQFEQGLLAFQRPYQEFKQKPQNCTADYQRLAAKCLKKIGWNFRRCKEYQKAYAAHLEAYQIYEQHGAFAELHDAAISLNIDAYFLAEPKLDEAWLRKSIVAAEQIPDAQRKARALGISYNNLAGVLVTLQKFAEAESCARFSLENWSNYEKLLGHSENKVLWAYFGLGEVLFAAGKIAAAHEAYVKAQKLSDNNSLSQTDLQLILECIKKSR